MTLLWCSSKFAQLYKLSLCNKIIIQLLLIHFTVQIFQRLTVGTDLYSYELTWVSEYNEVPVFIYPCFN